MVSQTFPEKRQEPPRESRADIQLTHTRTRDFIWMIIYATLGTWLLLRQSGDVFTVLGVFLLWGALSNGRSFAKSFLDETGRISIGAGDITLPRDLYARTQVTVPIGEVRHAYLIRRALPWGTPSPLLVIETRSGSFEYPAHWFEKSADQVTIATLLGQKLGCLR